MGCGLSKGPHPPGGSLRRSMGTARTLRLPVGDVLTHWWAKAAEVYGARFSRALHVAASTWVCLRSEGPPSAPHESPRRVVQLEVLFDRVAGRDVRKASLTVCVRTGPRARRSGGLVCSVACRTTGRDDAVDAIDKLYRRTETDVRKQSQPPAARRLHPRGDQPIRLARTGAEPSVGWPFARGPSAHG